MTRRVAVITRTGTAIGAAVARRLANDGLAVAAVDGDEVAARAVADEIEKADGTGTAVGGDVGDPDGALAVVETVTRTLGPPAVLVNCACPPQARPFAEMSLDDWDMTMRDGLRAYFLMSRAVLPALRNRGHGRIVNIAAMAAMGARHEADYAAAMAGVEGLTRALAVELGPDGITVNAVAPGYVDGAIGPAEAAQFGVRPERVARVVAMRAPVRRVGRPEDIAAAAAFLAEEESGFISGQVLMVTGGLLP